MHKLEALGHACDLSVLLGNGSIMQHAVLSLGSKIIYVLSRLECRHFDPHEHAAMCPGVEVFHFHTLGLDKVMFWFIYRAPMDARSHCVALLSVSSSWFQYILTAVLGGHAIPHAHLSNALLT